MKRNVCKIIYSSLIYIIFILVGKISNKIKYHWSLSGIYNSREDYYY